MTNHIQNAVAKAIRHGELVRPQTCSECKSKSGRGAGTMQGHHDDYAKPLDVRWLCSSCHIKWHKHNTAKSSELAYREADAVRTPLGRRLETLRIERQLSCSFLERHAGIAYGLVSKIESGRRPNPTLGTVAALAKALGCMAGWLAFGTGERE